MCCECERRTESCACCKAAVATFQICDNCGWQHDDYEVLPNGHLYSSANGTTLEDWRTKHLDKINHL